MDPPQREAIASLTKAICRWPDAKLRRLIETGPPTAAMAARAVLDLRPAEAPDADSWIRDVFPHRPQPPGRPMPDEPTEEQLDEAETYLDAIGNLVDIPGDPLAASTHRDEIDAEPFNHERWDSAVDTHVAGTSPAPTTGGTLTTLEDADRIRILGNEAYDRALRSLNGLDEDLAAVMKQLANTAATPDESTNTASGILGQGHSAMTGILEAAAGWANSIDPLKQLVTQLKKLVSDLTRNAQQIPSAYDVAAQAISGGGV